MTDVKVAVLEKPGVHALLRIRPGRGDERVRSELLNLRGPTCVEFRPSGSVYSFDAVLGQEAEQADVFEIIRPLINSLFSERCNSTILTYGQTGSGKTHTLIGTTKEQGILPRAASMLCDAMRMRPSEKIKVTMSAIELYCDRVRDLINPDKDNLQIVQDREGGSSVTGAEKIPLVDQMSCSKVLSAATAQRAVASTGLNARSSRSHCIFRFDVSWPSVTTGADHACLSLVDLAGSERTARSRTTGQIMSEGSAINLSLSALGNVVAALTTAKPKSHIPFRSSKLTRLLQPSLCGSGRTALLLCVSSASSDETETLGTLRFGARTKNLPIKIPPALLQRGSVAVSEDLAVDAELGVPEPADPSVVLGAPGPDKMFCEGGEKDSCGGRVIRPLPDGIAPDALARARWPDWDGLQVARWTSAAQLLGVVLFVGIEGLLSTRAAKSGAL